MEDPLIRLCDLVANPARSLRCDNCTHWGGERGAVGTCNATFLIKQRHHLRIREDEGGGIPTLETGPSFGCLLFELEESAVEDPPE